MDNLVVLDGVDVSLGGSPVLRDLHLEVAAGEVVGISGPNGSGKTTLVRTLATLQRAEHGSGRILGEDIYSGQLRRVRPRIGLIGHVPGLISELTLRENLEHIANLAEIDPKRVEHALEVVGLAEAADRRAAASSFGMKRRIEAAHLMLRQPELLLLDEAISGLDSSASDLIGAIVEANIERGGASILVSHDAELLSTLTERTLRLETGKLKADE